MSYTRVVLSAATCLFAAALFAAEPECATNYHSDGKSAETFVTTALTPQAAIERLPRLLIAAGASMRTSEPEKGILNAEGLDVQAEAHGGATRVTFRSSIGADKAALCRYASLVGHPPLPPVPQDPALIAQMKDDLLKKRLILQPETGGGVSSATITSPTDFLEFVIKGIHPLADGKSQYDVSILLPRASCSIVSENVQDMTSGFVGKLPNPRTKPARVEITLVYTKDARGLQLADASISHIESTK